MPTRVALAGAPDGIELVEPTFLKPDRALAVLVGLRLAGPVPSASVRSLTNALTLIEAALSVGTIAQQMIEIAEAHHERLLGPTAALGALPRPRLWSRAPAG